MRISRTCSSLTVEPHDVNNGTRSVIDTKPASFAMLRVTTMSRVTTLIKAEELVRVDISENDGLGEEGRIA